MQVTNNTYYNNNSSRGLGSSLIKDSRTVRGIIKLSRYILALKCLFF